MEIGCRNLQGEGADFEGVHQTGDLQKKINKASVIHTLLDVDWPRWLTESNVAGWK
jgi:hypothetical protein